MHKAVCKELNIYGLLWWCLVVIRCVVLNWNTACWSGATSFRESDIMFSTVLNIIDAVWCPASSLKEFTTGVPKLISVFQSLIVLLRHGQRTRQSEQTKSKTKKLKERDEKMFSACLHMRQLASYFALMYLINQNTISLHSLCVYESFTSWSQISVVFL